MNWGKITHLTENTYEVPGSILHPHYYEALNVLFRIENSLRIIVYIVLKDSFREKWSEISITSDDQASTTINAIARRRISQDNNFAYLGYENTNPLMYLTSGELIRIITAEQYWKYFKDQFRGSKEIMRNKLDEIGNIRNSLAHFRPIRAGDVDLIRQNALHALSKIEESIVSILTCSTIVPSNSEEKWFRGLSTIGNQDVKFSFSQSADGVWVKIGLRFKAPILSQRSIGKKFALCRTVRLSAPNVLARFKKLNDRVILATEEVPRMYPMEKEPEFRKTIEFRFSRRVLASEWQDLKSDFESILNTLDSEIELIRQDNLAKGTLVELLQTTAEKEDGLWSFNMESLKSKPKKSDPVEYWAYIDHISSDYISDSENFPWMNATISEDKAEPPF